MRNTLFILIIFLFVITSCSTTSNFYQVYTTENLNGKATNEYVQFEDSNCVIQYNLWSNNGNVGFKIKNKTNNDITIDISKTFFVINGLAYSYFKNRSQTTTNNTGVNLDYMTIPNGNNLFLNYSQGIFNSNSKSTTYYDNKEITIPPLTATIIEGYAISNSRYINCDLSKTPTSEKLKTVKFGESNSPFIFYNIITYSINNTKHRIENKFYVSEITNYPESMMFTKVYTSICGRKLTKPEIYFKNPDANKFYYFYRATR